MGPYVFHECPVAYARANEARANDRKHHELLELHRAQLARLVSIDDQLREFISEWWKRC